MTIAAPVAPATLGEMVDHSHLRALDGWRAISILSVLACHLLPIGPKWLQLNAAAGLFGMSLFFTLSGFLITSTLLRDPRVVPFVIRRLCRILPLAYLYIVLVLTILQKGPAYFAYHGLFLTNYQTEYATDLTAHFWSLCVEVQFYLGISLIVLFMGKRGLLLLPALGAGVTLLRIYTGTHASIATHLRVDEILAGATLALVMSGALPSGLKTTLRRIPSWAWFLGLLVSCHAMGGPANYLRPYLAAGLVGSTIAHRTWLGPWLETRPFRYIAETSYALYVIHPLAAWGWLGTGGTIVKYAVKRPITFVLTFAAAHLSTFYYERRWISLGKTWAKRGKARDVSPLATN